MREVFEEYGAMVLSVVGTFALFLVVKEYLFVSDSLFAQLIFLWGNGGC